MQQLSIELNAAKVGAEDKVRPPKPRSWFVLARHWFAAVLQEQRAIDEQVTAPLLRRYRQQKSRKSSAQAS